MMNVHPEHYIRVIKATHPMLVCRYSDSRVLSTGDQCYVSHIPERGGAREGQQEQAQQTQLLEEKKNLIVTFVSSEEEIKVRMWVNFNSP